MLPAWLNDLANNKELQLLLLLVVADFAIGVLAAFKQRTFRLSYIGNFASDDLLGKVVPFAAVFILNEAAKAADILIPGVDLDVMVHGTFAVIVAAFAGSLLSSLADLGVTLPAAVAGGQRTTPPTPDPPDNAQQ